MRRPLHTHATNMKYTRNTQHSSKFEFTLSPQPLKTSRVDFSSTCHHITPRGRSTACPTVPDSHRFHHTARRTSAPGNGSMSSVSHDVSTPNSFLHFLLRWASLRCFRSELCFLICFLAELPFSVLPSLFLLLLSCVVFVSLSLFALANTC